MKKIYLACLFLGNISFLIYGGEVLYQAQTLHREIGKNLVQIRRENPSFQSTIYTLLDQVGQLYKITNISLQKKRKIKLATQEEKQFRIFLENDNEKLKTEIIKLKQSIKEEKHKLTESYRHITSLTKEKSELLKKKNEQDVKEKEYLARVKKLESSINKIDKNENMEFENDTITLNKNKDGK